MAALTEWVRRLVLLVIVVSFLELLTPNNTLQRYVRLVVGFLILTAVVTPLVALVRGEDVFRLATRAGEARRPDAPAGAASASALAETNRRLQNELLADRLRTYLVEELAKTAQGRVGVAVRVDGEGEVQRVSITAPPGQGARLKARAAALSGVNAGRILVVEEAIP